MRLTIDELKNQLDDFSVYTHNLILEKKHQIKTIDEKVSITDWLFQIKEFTQDNYEEE